MSKLGIIPVGRKSNLVVQEFDNELLIYDLNENKAFSLNQTSAMIWQLCDGDKTISEIAKILSEKINSPINEDFIRLALEQLKKDNLLEFSENLSIDFNGLSRREIIRKIGLATMVALPMISSVVVPTAINAQSGICASGPCRCLNDSSGCNGTVGTVGGVTYISCRSASNGNPRCNCIGPFGQPNSAGSTYKTGRGCFIS